MSKRYKPNWNLSTTVFPPRPLLLSVSAGNFSPASSAPQRLCGQFLSSLCAPCTFASLREPLTEIKRAFKDKKNCPTNGAATTKRMLTRESICLLVPRATAGVATGQPPASRKTAARGMEIIYRSGRFSGMASEPVNKKSVASLTAMHRGRKTESHDHRCRKSHPIA